MLSSIVQTSDTGTDSVEAATGYDMAELVYQWQMAIMTYGEVTESGDPLLDPKEYTPYADPVEITAPTSSPAKGDLFGANGYQQGFNVNGENYYVEGGTTATPEENEDNRVRTAHGDPSCMPTARTSTAPSRGLRRPGHPAGQPPYDETTIQIRSDSTDYVALVVRWNDPDADDFSIEQSISPTDQSNLSLPALPTDGSPIYAVGG